MILTLTYCSNKCHGVSCMVEEPEKSLKREGRITFAFSLVINSVKVQNSGFKLTCLPHMCQNREVIAGSAKKQNNIQQNFKTESPAAVTKYHLQLETNFISLQRCLVNLKHLYELHTQSRSWWSWKKIIKEIQQGKQRDFPSSFPWEFLSLPLVKTWSRNCSGPGYGHRYPGITAAPFPPLNPKWKDDAAVFTDDGYLHIQWYSHILHIKPPAQKNPNWQATTS